MYGELVFEVVVAGVAIFLYFVTMSMRVINPIPVMRPSWWPQIILVIMMIVDALLIYDVIRKIKKVEVSRKKEAPKGIWVWLVGEIIAVAVFIVLQTILGFFVSAIIFCVSSSFIIDGRFRVSHIWTSILIASIITVFFGTLLGLPLPRGTGALREFSYLIY